MPSRRSSTRTLNRRLLDEPRNREENVDWITWAKEAGAYIAPLLMGAVIWLNTDRNRLLDVLKDKDAQLSDKDDKLLSLSERTLVTMAEIKTFLFNSGRPA